MCVTPARGPAPARRALVGALLLAACGALAGPASAQSSPPGKVPEIDLEFVDPHLVRLSWLAPVDAERGVVTAYRVYARTSASSGPGDGAPMLLAEVPGDAREAMVAEYPTGTTVIWSVAAVNAAGEGPRSDEVTTRLPPVYGPPLALRASLGEHRVVLAWDPPADKTDHAWDPSYLVYRRVGDDGVATLLGATWNLTAEDADPPDGARVTYHVVANTTTGASPPSEPVTVTTPFLPAAPTDVRATPGPGRVALSWAPPPPLPDGSRVERFRIYRAEPGDGAPVLLREVVGVHAWTDRDLPHDVTFVYAVRAVTGWGEGPASPGVHATTRSLPPPVAAQDPLIAPSFWATAPIQWTLGTLVTTLVGGLVLAARARRQAVQALVEDRASIAEATPDRRDALRAFLDDVRDQKLAAPPGIRAARRRVEAAMDALDRAPRDDAARTEFHDAWHALHRELERQAGRWALPYRKDKDEPGAAVGVLRR